MFLFVRGSKLHNLYRATTEQRLLALSLLCVILSVRFEYERVLRNDSGLRLSN